MKSTKYKGLVSVLIIVIMIMTTTQPLVTIIDGGVESANSLTDGSELETYTVDDVAINPPSLKKDVFYSKSSYKSIIVATSDIGELASLLSKCEYNGLIGSQSSNTKGMAFPILDVPENMIPEIEMLPHVYGIYDYHDPVTTSNFDYQGEFSSYSVPREQNRIIENSMNIDHASYYHGAETAWENGFTGEGVNVAAITAGIDFGHYELNGRQAVDTNTSSPYYNYPIAFDSTSMAAYFADGLPLGYETPGDTWYVNTSNTDLHVYHTIIIDGVNDFWNEIDIPKTIETYYNKSQTTELKATDPEKDMKELAFDLSTLNVASDIENWYVGFSVAPEVESDIFTWKRSFDVNYGLYIDTVAGGATTDPLGNYLDTSATNNPEYAIYIHHNGVKWGIDEDGDVWTENNTLEDAVFYSWDGAAWNPEELINLTNEQAFGGDFVEFPIPKTMLDNANSMSLMLFSVGDNNSHAQDTVPADDNVAFSYPDWGMTNTTLTNFTFIDEPVEYIVTGIPSASGVYHIGLHPDQSLIKNYYGRPAAVLLTDYYDSGVYDTVYVDLDNDKCFTDEIPAMAYGAYNESLMIGPEWGTIRLANNSIIHNSTWYNLETYSHESLWSNETLTASATGGESTFFLGNTSVDPGSLVIDRPASQIHTFANDSVVYEIDDTEMTPWSFFLPNGNITNFTYIAILVEGDPVYNLTEADPTVEINSVTGEVTLIDSDLWDNAYSNNQIVELYAWYEYVDVAFTFNPVSSQLTLNESLIAGDYLNVMYNYELTSGTNITNVNRHGTIFYNSNFCDIELRDWTAIKDVDSDNGTGDGEYYQDISGGMVYYISNGTNPIPYSEVFWDRNGIEEKKQKIPGNAAMVAFFGEYTLDSLKGTQVGSTICGMGTGVDNNNNVLIKGMAPKAKLIPIRSGNPFEDWYFAVEGYDGCLASGDEAQIVTISNNFEVQETGWDIYTKAADYIGTCYAKGNAIFIAGVGDGGDGYGTASSPGSSNAVITAGVGTQFDYRNYKTNAPGGLARDEYVEGGPNTHNGDVLPSSSRGPNMLGQPEPDVITAGAFVFASTPLNADQDTTTSSFEWCGGKWALDIVSGSFISSSSTAGMMALIYDAYYQKHGSYPNAEEARSLIRSGADNMNYDILVQGAGYTNVDRSTKLAADLDGIYLNDTFWVPGDYRGIKYDGFVKLSKPGETYEKNFVLSNRNSTEDANIEIYDAVFNKFDSYEMPFNITKTYDVKDIPGVINIEPLIPIGTELMKVTITSERKANMLSYMGELFDWTDTSEDGEMNFPEEQNRMVYTIGTNHLELRYRDPLGRVHDGLAIQVKDLPSTGESLTDWIIHLDFYEKADWDWLTLSNTPTNLTGGEESSFDTSLSIPSDAGVGSYEGSIYIKQSEPQEHIGTGIGEVMKNITFEKWFNNTDGAEGIINDPEISNSTKYIIPLSTIIRWNDTYLYEGVDYYLSGTGGAVKFYDHYPDLGKKIPVYADYFNITYLRANAINGIPTEEATWSGETNVPNLVKDDYTLRKDGIIWDEVNHIHDEKVINRNYEAINETVYTATGNGTEFGPFFLNNTVLNSTLYLSNVSSGKWTRFVVNSNYTLDNTTGELNLTEALWIGQTLHAYYNYSTADGIVRTNLFNRNIVRRTATLTLNGPEWSQDGGETTESFIMGAGQDEVTLSNGNIVSGSSKVIFEGNEMAQTGEITVLNKEVIQGLNSTSIVVEDEALTPDAVTWDDMFFINSIDKPEFQILSYIIYEDGVALIDGDDFNMHVDSTHGKFRLDHDPAGHTYYASYEYYDKTLKFGQLEHGNIVSDSFTIYKNGVVMSKNEYETPNLVLGMFNLTNELEPNVIIDIAYKYNIYKVDGVSGAVTFSDPFDIGDNIDVIYSFYNYILDLPTGKITFSSPLQAGDIITANYSYAHFTINRKDGIVMFANPLLPGENVTIEYSHYLSMIPVFINIGANKPDFTFGGTEQGSDLYNYNEITGGYGSGTGDWRYIYMDILEQGLYGASVPDEEKEKHRVMVDVEWENNLTDVDVQVFGGRTSIPKVFGDPMPSDIYGPHSIQHIGGSDESANFFTTTGVGREIVAPQISSGLNIIGLHTVGFNGSKDHTESYTGRVGTMYIDKPSLNIVTNELVGETQINMNSNMEWSGVGGIAAGPSAPESLKNQTIYQDDINFPIFEDILAAGTTVYSRTIKDCLIFHVHIWGDDNAPDMDLGVFLDGSGKDEKPDGKVQVDEFVAYGADMDADEEVRLIAPKDGTYLIVPVGYSLTTNSALFDMDITIVQGTGFNLQGKGENSLSADQKGYFSSNQTEEAFNQTYLNLSWDLPGSTTGTLQGALYLGPGNGPMSMLVPIELTIDTDAPIITVLAPSEGAYTNNQKPEIVVSVSDFERGELIPGSMKLYIDSVDISMQSHISIPFDDDDDDVQGYITGAAAYTPTIALIDGTHVVKASIMDEAGNTAVEEWAFTVDSSMPSVEVSYPADSITYVNTESITVTGTAEAGLELAIVGITGAELIIGNNGAFSANIALAKGDNSFIIRATDLAGNTIDIKRTVYRDNDVPSINRVKFSDGYITNEPITTISGSISERGTLMVDGVAVTVNSDGTFSHMIQLIEGVNLIYLEYADMAGNVQYEWYNVTLDTVAPVISLSTDAATVHNRSFELIGTVEAGAEVFVNGKRTTVGTRQTSEFSTTLTLSPGINKISIKAEDDAGNIAQHIHIVEYEPDSGAMEVNWPAIGIMISLLFVGLVLGLLFGSMLGGGGEPLDEPTMDEFPPEDMDSIVPEDADTYEEIPEDIGMEENPEEENLEEEGIEPVPVDEDSDLIESAPDELPEEESSDPDDSAPEADTPPDDPRIAKLKEAFESGKISEELYQKNLARFQKD